MQAFKTCKNGHILNDDNIYFKKTKTNKIYKICKLCKAEARHKYHIKNRDKSNQKSLLWKTKQRLLNKCLNCSNGKTTNNKIYCSKCLNIKKLFKLVIKLECFKLYGNRCKKCNITETDFLTIHHINNDGNIERFNTKNHGGAAFYRRLTKLSIVRNDLELLCFNCNMDIQLTKIKSNNSRQTRCNNKIKQKILNLYGNQCKCCKENNINMLCVDHINNDGSEERRKIGSSTILYRTLLNLDYIRTDIQILCFNCNESKKINSGHCIHNIL